ncbi:hypothetical protein LCM19_03170 [Qipengyuania flava]|nr:hypothetical protein [Qipengyuania flava]
MEFKAEVNYSTGQISASGSEDFVMRVLEWAKDQRDHYSAEPLASEKSTPHSRQTATQPANQPETEDPLAKFSDVFDRRGDDVAVIADTKKNSTAATARLTTLLYLLGRKLIGKAETSDEQIRELCEEHACYDSKNFSTHMDGLKGKIIQDGSSRKFTAKLTTPGEREAKTIAEKIQSDSTQA